MSGDRSIETRVRGALHELELQARLPPAFASDVARRLPDRPASRRRWSMRAGALVGSAAAALAIVVLAGAAVLLPQLRATPAAVSTYPTATSTPPLSSQAPSPSEVALARYGSGGGLSFDYPANWVVLATLVDHHYKQWGPAAGIGEFHADCATCGSGPWWKPAPGGVVVVFEWNSAPGQVAPTPPPGALLLADGVRATETENPEGSVWTLYVPETTNPFGGRTAATAFTIVATYAAPNIEVSRAQVRDLVHSILLARFDGATP